jgi:hypothetical protein
LWRLRQRSCPFFPVRPETTAIVLEPRRTRRISEIPATGSEPASTRAVATTWPPIRFAPTPATRAGGRETVIAALAEMPSTVAVIVPRPARDPAVKDVAEPVAGATRPSTLEESVHAGETATALPYASVPVAAKL